MIPEGANSLRQHRESSFIVAIDKHGVKTVGNSPIESNDAMRCVFTQLLSRNPLSALSIRADAHAPFEAITDVMLLARKAGVSDIFVIVGEHGTKESGKTIVVEQSIKLDLE